MFGITPVKTKFVFYISSISQDYGVVNISLKQCNFQHPLILKKCCQQWNGPNPVHPLTSTFFIFRCPSLPPFLFRNWSQDSSKNLKCWIWMLISLLFCQLIFFGLGCSTAISSNSLETRNIVPWTTAQEILHQIMALTATCQKF